MSLKYLLKGNNEKLVNTDMTIGKNFELLSDITRNDPGTIKVNGVVWSCACEDDSQEVKAGTRVEVLRVKGNKYIVKPLAEEKEKKEEEK